MFTKPARPGQVKTRLIGELSAIQAAELHAAFVEDLLERLATGDFDLRLLWAVDTGEAVPPSQVLSRRQVGADLGLRLLHGLRDALTEYPVAAAVGSDHPDLPMEHLEAAFERLEEGAELVLGPASDGGFYLIGARPGLLRTELFDGVEWSTDEVFASTMKNARAMGLTVETLPEASDVDTADDLAALAGTLAARPELCPRTHALLDSWSRLAGSALLETVR